MAQKDSKQATPAPDAGNGNDKAVRRRATTSFEALQMRSSAVKKTGNKTGRRKTGSVAEEQQNNAAAGGGTGAAGPASPIAPPPASVNGTATGAGAPALGRTGPVSVTSSVAAGRQSALNAATEQLAATGTLPAQGPRAQAAKGQAPRKAGGKKPAKPEKPQRGKNASAPGKKAAGRADEPVRQAPQADILGGSGMLPKVKKPLPGVFRDKERTGFRPLAAMGQLLYNLGFAGELRVLQIWRVVRDGGAFFGQLLVWLFGSVLRWIGGFFKGLFRDLTAPFRRFAKRRQQLRRVRERARRRVMRGGEGAHRTFFGVGAKSALQLLLNIAGIAMPVAAAVALVFTVQNVMNMKYALAVEIDGQVLGYVADQTVVENAKGLLRDRIKLAGNQELSDWQLNATYTIAKAANYTTTQELVNEILMTGATAQGDLVQATGLYVDGELYAVTTEGQRLRSYLDEKLESYEGLAGAGAVVSFVRQVECEPNEEDVFFTSSVEDYDELLQQLERNVSDELRYTVEQEETLVEVAHRNAITPDELRARNQQFADAEDDLVLEVGTEILVVRAQPFLQVKVAVRRQSTETIAYAVEEKETDRLARGVRQTVQEGVEGLREVWYDYVYIDGELEERVLVEEMTTVLSEPVNQVIEVGTYDFSSANIGDSGGAYLFPVPASSWSSRGYRPGGHRGMDINGNVGDAVLAANEGIVVTAGWHWSYGNYVMIEHPDGITTLYGHNSALFVTEGQVVKRGDHIAALGSTGNSSGPHVHLEFQYNGGLLNPLDYVVPPYALSY